jgi:RNA polymerase sigma-70 factor (ECF subfamily)
MNLKPYIKKLKHKDQAAFEAVYQQTKHAVFAMVIPIVKDQSLAEDVMQETYITMIEKINSYNPRYKFINWLLTIAKHKAIDMYRSREKDWLIDASENTDLFTSHESSIEKRMEVEEYLSLLNDEQKQVVLLKVIGDLTHKDIAYVLNKPIGTITWMYSESLKIMQQSGKERHNEKK